MLAVVIREGRPAQEVIADTFEALQNVVDGYVEPFFTIPSPEGNGSLTGYVNEEGLMLGLPIDFGVFHAPNYVVPLAGNAVIVGLDDEGETRGLTQDEADRVVGSFKHFPLCPIIEGREPKEGEPIQMVPVNGMLLLPKIAQA